METECGHGRNQSVLINDDKVHLQMSHLVGKQTMWFPTRSDTDRPVQAQKQARGLKFRI